MACFVVPVTEAVVTTIAGKIMKSKEQTPVLADVQHDISFETEVKIPVTRKLTWLSNLLWGGSALLAFEHMWHGEIVPWFPFLTAVNDPAETAAMLHEMATVGGAMAVCITAVWFGMCVAADRIVRRTGSKDNTISEVRG